MGFPEGVLEYGSDVVQPSTAQRCLILQTVVTLYVSIPQKRLYKTSKMPRFCKGVLKYIVKPSTAPQVFYPRDCRYFSSHHASSKMHQRHGISRGRARVVTPSTKVNDFAQVPHFRDCRHFLSNQASKISKMRHKRGFPRGRVWVFPRVCSMLSPREPK